MAKTRVNPHAQGRIDDPAEAWLRQNDPHYASNKRKWIAPTTDALSRAIADPGPHPSLEGLRPLPQGGGGYSRSRSGGVVEDVE